MYTCIMINKLKKYSYSPLTERLDEVEFNEEEHKGNVIVSLYAICPFTKALWYAIDDLWFDETTQEIKILF